MRSLTKCGVGGKACFFAHGNPAVRGVNATHLPPAHQPASRTLNSRKLPARAAAARSPA